MDGWMDRGKRFVCGVSGGGEGGEEESELGL